MKKQYSIFTFLFVILILNISIVYAENVQTTITAENAVTEAGSNVDISVNLNDNPGICGAILTVEIDEALVLTNIDSGSAFSSLIMTKPGSYDSNEIRIVWDGLEEDFTNGEIAKLSFLTPDQPGKYDITLSYQEGDIVDGNLNSVDVIVESGSITIEDNGLGSDHTDHSGGTATCITKAICAECGEEYGDIDPNNHVHTEVRNKKDATATEDGYTGDTYCVDCNALLEQGEVIPKYDIVIDDAAPAVYIQDATALVGKDIVIPVRIRFNPGIAGFSYDLIYDDSVMTLNSVGAGEILTSGQVTTNGNVVNWYATDNINGDGTILNLSFTVAEDATVGKVAVAVTPHDGKRNLVDETGSYVEANYLAGMIDISKGIIGDVNGDDDITIADVVVLNRHVLGKTVLSEEILAFADVNNDGDVTIGDVVVLNRRVLGKDNNAATGNRVMLKTSKNVASLPEVTTIKGDNTTVLPGETFDLPVLISGNTGIAGIALSIEIPDGYTLNAITKGDVLSEGTFSTNGFDFTWYTSDNVSVDGTLIILNLTVNEEAEDGSVIISVKEGKANNISNEEGKTVQVEFEPIMIDVDRRTECEKNGHSGGEATCIHKAVCDICHEEYGDVDPDNHAGETEVRNRKASTVSEEGYTGDIYCKDCETLLQSGTVIEKIKDTHIHEYTETITKQPTCREKGIKTFICQCGDTYTEEIEEAEHNLEYIAEVSADCITAGNIAYYHCRICDKDFLNSDGSSELTEDQIIVQEKGHSWDDGTITVEATPGMSGVITFLCKECGEIRTEDYEYVEPVIISDHAFAGNTNLKSFVIGASITNIGDEAFAGCENLREIYFQGDMPQFGKDVFKGIDPNAVIFYPTDNQTWNEQALISVGIQMRTASWDTASGDIIIKDISECTITLSYQQTTYDGSPKKPEIIVKDGEMILKPDKDYTVLYMDNVNAGIGNITINGLDNYQGAVQKEFFIEKAKGTLQLSEKSITRQIDDEEFDLEVISLISDGVVTYISSDTSVATVDHDNGHVKINAAGTTTITATVIGENYTTETFETVLTVQQPEVEKPGNTEQSEGNNHDGAGQSGGEKPNDTEQPQGEKQNSTGQPEVKKPNNTTLSEAKKQENGKKPVAEKQDNTITVTDLTLKGNGKKQTVALNASALGQAALSYSVSQTDVSVSGNGQLTIPAAFAGKIIVTVKAAETTQFKSAKKDVSVIVLPKKMKLSKVKPSGSRKAKVTWKKNVTAQGYELQCATNKKFTKNLKTFTIKKMKTAKKTVKKLKGGKRYYFRIRAYITVDEVKYYADWSKVKKVKIRK